MKGNATRPIPARRRNVRAGRALAVAFAVAVLPGAAAAQQFALDAEPFAGSASLAWRTGPGAWLGVALGAGIPQLIWTVRPDSVELEEYLHAAAFYRRRAGALEADVGVRLGVADLYECGESDCWPGWFAGAYGAVFAGWEHIRFGARIVAGSQQDPNEPRTFVVSVTPLIVRISFGGG